MLLLFIMGILAGYLNIGRGVSYFIDFNLGCIFRLLFFGVGGLAFVKFF